MLHKVLCGRKAVAVTMLVLSIALGACEGDEPMAPDPQTVSVTPDSARIEVGGSVRLVAKTDLVACTVTSTGPMGSPNSTAAACGRVTGASRYQWLTRNAKVAKVTSEGEVIGIAPGITYIIAEDLSVLAAPDSARITVLAPPKPTLAFTDSVYWLQVGQSAEFAPKLRNTNPAASAAQVTWSSSNEAAVSVSSSGVVRAHQPVQVVIKACPAGQGDGCATTKVNGFYPQNTSSVVRVYLPAGQGGYSAALAMVALHPPELSRWSIRDFLPVPERSNQIFYAKLLPNERVEVGMELYFGYSSLPRPGDSLTVRVDFDLTDTRTLQLGDYRVYWQVATSRIEDEGSAPLPVINGQAVFAYRMPKWSEDVAYPYMRVVIARMVNCPAGVATDKLVISRRGYFADIVRSSGQQDAKTGTVTPMIVGCGGEGELGTAANSAFENNINPLGWISRSTWRDFQKYVKSR